MCIECFESKDIDPKHLDSHDHDPFSPGCFVPFHPFTKRYACTKKLELGDRASSDSNWSAENSEDEDNTKKKNKSTKTGAGSKKRKATNTQPQVKTKVKKKKKSIQKPDGDAASPKDTGDGDAAVHTPAGDDDVSEDDGIELDEAFLKPKAVITLEGDANYQRMLRQTVKARRASKNDKVFQTMRQAIRTSAAAARAAYVKAAQSQPGTPEVTEILQDNKWDSVLDLTTTLKDRGWFDPPPKKSLLRREPACAWFTAGKTEINQKSKDLPALHKDVLRKALKRWIELYFYLPVAGFAPNDDKHINMMEYFVTFVWAYYTENQRPKIPAFTDVGRFIFTYIWRHQHALFR